MALFRSDFELKGSSVRYPCFLWPVFCGKRDGGFLSLVSFPVKVRVMDRQGFTLIEVVLVILILAILAGVVIVPSMDLRGVRAGTVSRKLVSDIRYAQQMSNTTRIIHGVVIFSGSYTVFQNDNPGDPTRDPETGGGFVVPISGDFEGVTLSPVLGSSPNHDVVKFDSLGTPYRRDGASMDGVSGNTIIVSGGSVSRTVTIEPETGKVWVN